MAVTRVGGGMAVSSVSNGAFTAPSDRQIGDLIVLGTGGESNNDVAGWVKPANGTGQYRNLYYRFCDGTASDNWPGTNGAYTNVTVWGMYRGVKNQAPIYQVGHTLGGFTMPTQSIPAAGGVEILIYGTAGCSNYNGANGGQYTTFRGDASSIGQTASRGVMYDTIHAGAVATTQKNVSSSSDGSGTWGTVFNFSVWAADATPTVPPVTAPNGGEIWDQTHTITWGAATDPDGTAVTYDVELTTNGGGTWTRLVSGTSATSLSYNFVNQPQVSNARVRVRANSAGLSSAWDESNANFTIMHQFATPTAITPGNGSTLNTDIPTLGATLTGNGQPQKIEWQLATNTAFSANLRTITQPDSALKTTGVQTMVVPNASMLFQGTWYLRARGIGSGGANASAWSATNTLTVTHPPTSINHTPTGSQYVAYGTGVMTLDTAFSDTSPVDAMTAAQFIVERNDTGALVNDSGKVARTGANASFTTSSIGAALKDVMLRWKVRLWDSDDVAGAYSSYHLFMAADLPVVTITSPGDGAQVNSGQPTVNWTFAATSGRTQSKRRVFFTRTSDSVIVHDTGLVTTSSLTYTPPTVVLQNIKNYTVTVEVQDTGNLSGSDTNAFSTSYDQPASKPFTVDSSGFENLGYVLISWNDATAKDVDWYAWRVYRREVGAATWDFMEEYRTTSANYTYRDYLAKSGTPYEYAVIQVVQRFGTLIESAFVPTQTTPISAFYWIIFGEQATDSFKIENVTGDDPTEEYEQEEIVLIGRGRHMEYGTRFGWRGEINAQVFGDANKTARERWLQLREMKARLTSFYLRTPFGDLWLVAAGNLAFGRTPGHARNEYGTITIPYAEVAE